MRAITYLSSAVALAALGLPAQRTAQEQGQVWEFLAEKYDANNDNRVTAEEYDRGEDKFAAYDRNGDGVVTEADFTANRRGARGRGRGGRGQMNQTQADQMIARGADKDGNRTVTAEEWNAVLNAMEENGIVATGAITSLALQPNGRPRRFGGQMATAFVSTFDIDKDGNVQIAELSMVFARLDKDQNESLEWNEMGLAVVLPQKGEVAPDFEIPYRDRPSETVRLSSFAGVKPVALIFGSYT